MSRDIVRRLRAAPLVTGSDLHAVAADRIDELTMALESIRHRVCIAGTDRGDSGVLAIVDAALEPQEKETPRSSE